LLLKVLEGESEQTLATQLRFYHERALPDLGRNIKCGNSLIGPDFYDQQEMSFLDEEERYRINVFDWNVEFSEIMKAGGFDAVIGNPPYDVLEKDRGASSWPHQALSDYARTKRKFDPALGGKLNLFRFFIVQSLSLTRKDGRFGMIVPLALLADISCSVTRKHLLFNSGALVAECFPQKDNASRRVFKSAKLSTVIITCNASPADSPSGARLRVKVYPWNSFDDPYRECLLHYNDLKLLDPKTLPVPLLSSEQWQVCKKLHSASAVKHLGEVADFEVTRGEINQTIFRRFITSNPKMARMLKGVEIARFRIRSRLSQSEREWFDERAYLATSKAKPLISQRRIATQRITGVDERLRIVATIIEPPAYFADSTNSITRKAESPYGIEYLLGLLNSRLFQWRFKLTSTNNNVGTNELNSMPFRTIDFTHSPEKTLHDRMVELAERMLALHKQLATAKTDHAVTNLQRQIDATDAQIDKLVYELYELTPDEIKIVEAAT